MSIENLPERVRDLYAELRLVVESMERDLEKNLTKNNLAAGRRVRASLRKAKGKAVEIARNLLLLETATKEGKK